ncbi:MAG: hypothetical protein ACLPYZ_05490 [Limisphaerales bacterium]
MNMATGRSNQITKQIGEYLVASELGRIGLVAAAFSGNVPDYDIIATDSAFQSVPVQVKTTNGTSWQFDIRRFVNVRLDGKKQVMGRPVALSDNIVCVMLALAQYGKDRFFVLSLKTLQKALIQIHRNVLKKFGGVRPKKFDSFHCAIGEHELTPFKDAWIREFRDKRGLSVHDFSA